MNVLLTCAGRRNYLVRFFRAALAGRGRVLAADMRCDAPALYEADQAFVVPPTTDPSYVDVLLRICAQQCVGLLISLNDFELPLLTAQRARFLEVGAVPIISSPEVIATCLDKWAAYRFLETCGVAVPKTYSSLAGARKALDEGRLAFPLLLKPRWGTASIGIQYVDAADELELAYRLGQKRLAQTFLAGISASDPERKLLIQERLSGQEYGLDVINDLNGRYTCTFVKHKLAMRAGETDRAITVRHETLEKLGETIGRKLGHVGNLDCDVFSTEQTCYVIDMNPRFGGGYPFSHIAGADLPAALIAWAAGNEPDPEWLRIRPGVTAAKYDRLVIVDQRQELETAG